MEIVLKQRKSVYFLVLFALILSVTGVVVAYQQVQIQQLQVSIDVGSEAVLTQFLQWAEESQMMYTGNPFTTELWSGQLQSENITGMHWYSYNTTSGALLNRTDWIMNYVVQTASSPPSNPIQGALYIDTDDDLLYSYDGASWVLIGVRDHGGLTGLSDDDHTIYLLVDGTRALTANWDAGNFNITASWFIGILNVVDTTNTTTLYVDYIYENTTDHDVVFGSNIMMNLANRIYYRDDQLYITSANDGRLDLYSDNAIDLNAVTVFINNELRVDTINDYTGDAGVTIENVVIRNSDVTIPLSVLGTPTYSTLSNYITSTSSGVIDYGEVVENADGSINVTAGSGLIRVASGEMEKLLFIDWSTTNNIALTDDSINYIYCNYSSGSPEILVTTNFHTLYNEDTNFIIYSVYRKGTDVEILQENGISLVDYMRNQYSKLEHRGIQWMSGGVVAEIATRNLTVTEAVYYQNFLEVNTAAIDTNASDIFDAVYRNGGGGWTYEAGLNQFSNSLYDDGDGTPSAVGVAKYATYYVYQCLEGDIYVQYGQSSSNTLTQAQREAVPIPPTYLTQWGYLRAKIIILNGATNAYEISNVVRGGFIFYSAGIHNELAGLQGGAANDYYHLIGTVAGYLDGLDQYVNSTAGVTFATVDTGQGAYELFAMDQNVLEASEVTFSEIVITGLTGDLLVSTNSSSGLISVSDLTAWIAGTANQIVVVNDMDGTLTLNLPQDIDASADVTFDSLILDDLTASRLLASDGTEKLVSVADLTAWIAGVANEITITNDADGTITIDIPDAVTLDALTVTNITIGGNTLDTNEWAFLDGLDQALKQSDSPTFAGLTVTNNITADWYIGNLFGENITSGTVALARLPTMDDAHIPDLETLSYGGAFNIAQIPSIPDSLLVESGEYLFRNGSVALTASWNAGQAITVTTLDTGQGAYELFAMDQNVLAASEVTFAEMTISELTGSRLLATNATSGLVSVADLASWIAGTANQVTVATDGDGSVTLSLPQDIDASADVTFDSLILDDLTALRLVASDGSEKLVSVADLSSWIAGTAEQITVTTDGDGTITLSVPSDITYGNVTLSGTLYIPQYGSDYGTVLYLPFEEGTGSTTYDQSPYGNDGTITNGTWTAGKFGEALNFDGDGFVQVADHSSLDVTSVTVSLWVNLDSYPASYNSLLSSEATFDILAINDGNFYIELYIDSTWERYTSSGQTIGLGAWYHIALTFDETSGDSIVYVNGQPCATESLTAKPLTPSVSDLFVGKFRNADDLYAVNGTIDEVQIFNKALSLDEIRTHYLNTKGQYSRSVTVSDAFRILGTDLAVDFSIVSGNGLFTGTNQLQFRDAQIYIASLVDGDLDLTADGSIDIHAPKLDMTDGYIENVAYISLEATTPYTAYFDAGVSAPLGVFRTRSQSDLFILDGRNAADNGWEDIVQYERIADGGLVDFKGADGIAVNGTIDFSDIVGDKLLLFSNSYKIAVSSNDLDLYSQRSFKFHSAANTDAFVLNADDYQLFIRDGNIYLASLDDGYLDLEADYQIRLNANVNVTGGNVYMDGGNIFVIKTDPLIEFQEADTTIIGRLFMDSATDNMVLRTEDDIIFTTGMGSPSTLLQLTDTGQAQFPTTGSGAGIVLGGDAQLYRGDTNLIYVGAGDGMLFQSTDKVFFRDPQIYIASLNDGHLDLTADTSIDLNANTIASGYNITADYFFGNFDGPVVDSAIYAELSDSTDQAFTNVSIAYPITFNTNDEIVGLIHSTSVNPENITIVTAGVYTIFAQPQVAAGAGGSGTFHMWLQKDTGGGFADIPNTNIELSLASLEEDVIPLATTFSLNAGDTIRLMARVSDVKIGLDAQTPADEPAIPSIILTMFRIGA